MKQIVVLLSYSKIINNRNIWRTKANQWKLICPILGLSLAHFWPKHVKSLGFLEGFKLVWILVLVNKPTNLGSSKFRVWCAKFERIQRSFYLCLGVGRAPSMLGYPLARIIFWGARRARYSNFTIRTCSCSLDTRSLMLASIKIQLKTLKITPKYAQIGARIISVVI